MNEAIIVDAEIALVKSILIGNIDGGAPDSAVGGNLIIDCGTI
jgi:hypothetical protein